MHTTHQRFLRPISYEHSQQGACGTGPGIPWARRSRRLMFEDISGGWVGGRERESHERYSQRPSASHVTSPGFIIQGIAPESSKSSVLVMRRALNTQHGDFSARTSLWRRTLASARASPGQQSTQPPETGVPAPEDLHRRPLRFAPWAPAESALGFLS